MVSEADKAAAREMAAALERSATLKNEKKKSADLDKKKKSAALKLTKSARRLNKKMKLQERAVARFVEASAAKEDMRRNVVDAERYDLNPSASKGAFSDCLSEFVEAERGVADATAAVEKALVEYQVAGSEVDDASTLLTAWTYTSSSSSSSS